MLFVHSALFPLLLYLLFVRRRFDCVVSTVFFLSCATTRRAVLSFRMLWLRALFVVSSYVYIYTCAISWCVIA